jgi:hypothetical protein
MQENLNELNMAEITGLEEALTDTLAIVRVILSL